MTQSGPAPAPPALERPRWGRAARFAPHWADALLGLAVMVLSSNSNLAFTFSGEAVTFRVLAVVCGAAIVFRRVFPLASVLVIGVAMTAHAFLIEDLTLVALVGTLVAVWSTQSRLVPPWRWALLVFFCSGTVTVTSIRAIRIYEPTDLRGFIVLGAVAALVLAVAALGGARSRSIRDRRHLAAERLAMLEEQQQTLARLAVADERNRLAVDLHDLLGHTLTAISAQAEGARCVLAADPGRADEALAAIARISREGVDHVHTMVAFLREDGGSPRSPGAGSATGDAPASGTTVPHAPARTALASGTTAPDAVGAPAPAGAPGGGLWEQVSALAVQCGAPVRLVLDVAAAPALTPTQVSAMVRNCREALTNAMRHSAAGTITITGRSSGPRVSLAVENAISGPPAARSGGLGVASMVSRAQEADLHCEAGPDGGVWRVGMEAES